ncbi:unnamed protein product [Caenorhabditis bovis]|uniref:Ig-like domain-containing protein n=1 Tax=Caenorhabditis bovis TaxID=2654633 RepID=A0A8S1FBV1_9PELO|nr:unnamed protein product [Caenorhabditis bovis]
MINEALLVIIVSILPIAFSIIDESACPIGWQIASDQCIRINIPPETAKHAKKHCHREGGVLLDVTVNNLLDDVIDILQNLYEKGLTEPIFYVDGIGQALNRRNDGTYHIINVNPSSAYPYICSLDKISRRSLLFQQLLLPSGAPRIAASTPSEIYFHPRQDADYVALPCIVEGNPKPTVTWYRNDIKVLSPSSSNVSYLLSGGNLLVPANSSLAYSTFHCTAKNVYGEVRSPSILLKPSFLDDFRAHRLDVYSLSTGGAKLICDAPAHQPKDFGCFPLRIEKLLPFAHVGPKTSTFSL